MNFIAGIFTAEGRIQHHFCRPRKGFGNRLLRIPILQTICAQTVGALDLKAVKKIKTERNKKKWREIRQYVKVRNLENSDNIWQLRHAEGLLQKRHQWNFRALVSRLIGGSTRDPLQRRDVVVKERSFTCLIVIHLEYFNIVPVCRRKPVNLSLSLTRVVFTAQLSALGASALV